MQKKFAGAIFFSRQTENGDVSLLEVKAISALSIFRISSQMTQSIGSVQTRHSTEVFSCWSLPSQRIQHATQNGWCINNSSFAKQHPPVCIGFCIRKRSSIPSPSILSRKSNRFIPLASVQRKLTKRTMAFSVSRQQAVELAVLVSFAAFSVCCAGFFERNETGMAEQASAGMETISST